MDCQEKIMSEGYVDMMEDATVRSRLEDRFEDFCLLALGDDTSLVYVGEAEARKMFPGAEMFSVFPRCYAFAGAFDRGIAVPDRYDVLALDRSGILEVQNRPLSLTGKGTVLAIIGSGIDYTSPLFRRKDGSSRILAIWDQTIASGPAPEGLLYGTEFTREEIDRALKAEDPYGLVPHYDSLGYGTMLAAAAAGQLSDQEAQGSPAPDADLVVVKLKEAKQYLKDLYCIFGASAYQENDIMTALFYTRRFLQVARRPVTAYCMLGTTMGNHAGSGALDRYIERLLAVRNYSIVWCGGDEGNARRHFEGHFRQGDGRSQNVELNVPQNCPGFLVEFWAEKPAVCQLEIRSPGGEGTGAIQGKRVDFRRYDFVYGNGYLTVSYILAEDSSGWQSAVLRFVAPSAGIWNIQVRDTDLGMESRYHLWLPMRQLLPEDVYFVVSSPYVTLTSPVAERGLIVTSAYDARQGSFAVWSSRGYPDGRSLAPDLAAPGEQVDTNYGLISSSAVSAAFTAGAVCQMQQWGVTDKNDVLLDGTEIKNYLLRGAERKTDLTYPNREWGYGTLNLSGTFRKMAGITDAKNS